jgi:hypothetical protein
VGNRGEKRRRGRELERERERLQQQSPPWQQPCKIFKSTIKFNNIGEFKNNDNLY